MHHLQKIHMPLLIKIIKITNTNIQPIPQGLVTICDTILLFIIFRKSIEISQLEKIN